MADAVSVVEDVDKALLARLRAGDSEAFGQLYDRHCARVFAHIGRLVADRDAAEELTQETFLKAFANLTKGGPVRDFGAWIYQLATNEALMYLRHQRARIRLDAENDGLSQAEDPNGPDPGHSSAAGAVWAVAKRLSPLQRAVLILRFLDDQSYDQIAATLHRSTDAVTSLLNQAKRRFRTELARAIAHRPGAPDGCVARAEQIAAWLASDLKGVQAVDLQRHLSDCRYCQETRAQLEDLRGQWLLLPPLSVPATLRDRLVHTAGQHFHWANGAMHQAATGLQHARQGAIRQAWQQAIHSPAIAVAAPLVVLIAGLGVALTARPHLPIGAVGAPASVIAQGSRQAPGTGKPATLGPPSTFAFIRNGDVWLDQRGAALQQLTQLGNVTYFLWSPNGRWLAVLANERDTGFGFDVYTIAADGTGQRLVRKWVSTMAWSPDGRSLAVLWPQTLTSTLYTVDVVDPATGVTGTLAHFTTSLFAGGDCGGYPFMINTRESTLQERLAWTSEGIFAQGSDRTGAAPESPVRIDPTSGDITPVSTAEVQQAYDRAMSLLARARFTVSRIDDGQNFGFHTVLHMLSADGTEQAVIDVGRELVLPAFDAASGQILFTAFTVTSQGMTQSGCPSYSYQEALWTYDLATRQATLLLADGTSYGGFWQPHLVRSNTRAA